MGTKIVSFYASRLHVLHIKIRLSFTISLYMGIMKVTLFENTGITILMLVASVAVLDGIIFTQVATNTQKE